MSARQLIGPVLTGVGVGVITGFALIISYHCALGWAAGGSADPRCAIGLIGYVELHQLEHGRPDRTSCAYRPDLAWRAP